MRQQLINVRLVVLSGVLLVHTYFFLVMPVLLFAKEVLLVKVTELLV